LPIAGEKSGLSSGETVVLEIKGFEDDAGIATLRGNGRAAKDFRLTGM